MLLAEEDELADAAAPPVGVLLGLAHPARRRRLVLAPAVGVRVDKDGADGLVERGGVPARVDPGEATQRAPTTTDLELGVPERRDAEVKDGAEDLVREVDRGGRGVGLLVRGRDERHRGCRAAGRESARASGSQQGSCTHLRKGGCPAGSLCCGARSVRWGARGQVRLVRAVGAVP